ncbi:hypothetical protein Tco_0095070, partial [Tanacetum coccineum]
MPAANSYSAADVTVLDTHRTPIQKQPEALLVGLSQRYFLGDDVYPTFFYDDDRDMDLFNLISAPNPTKVKTETRPRVAHEVPLLTVTASRMIEMKDAAVAKCIDHRGRFRNRPRGGGGRHGPLVNKGRRKRGNNEAEANAPPKIIRRDHDAFRLAQSTRRGKYLASMRLDAGSILSTPAAHDPSTATKSVS